jgi:hypothetical protein
MQTIVFAVRTDGKAPVNQGRPGQDAAVVLLDDDKPSMQAGWMWGSRA